MERASWLNISGALIFLFISRDENMRLYLTWGGCWCYGDEGLIFLQTYISFFIFFRRSVCQMCSIFSQLQEQSISQNRKANLEWYKYKETIEWDNIKCCLFLKFELNIYPNFHFLRNASRQNERSIYHSKLDSHLNVILRINLKFANTLSRYAQFCIYIDIYKYVYI